MCPRSRYLSESKNLSPYSNGKRSSFLIKISMMTPPLPSSSASLPSQIPTSSLQIANFPSFPNYKQHLHSQFIPKSSNLLYFSVYTAVHLLAPLCSPQLLSGFYCELLEARDGICLNLLCTVLHVHTGGHRMTMLDSDGSWHDWMLKKKKKAKNSWVDQSWRDLGYHMVLLYVVH